MSLYFDSNDLIKGYLAFSNAITSQLVLDKGEKPRSGLDSVRLIHKVVTEKESAIIH